jgi:hypothetical protein
MTIQRWHKFAETKELSILNDLIAEDAVFHSPVVHTPQAGKQSCMMYLMAAMQVFSFGKFNYVGHWDSESGAVLEFVAEIEGIILNGVDIIRWNDQGQIVDFKVMIRPLKAVNLIHQKMQAMLQSMQ